MSARIVRKGRDKAYTPNPRAHYTMPPLLDAEGSQGTAWRAEGPIAGCKPTCTEPSCRLQAMAWSRCACAKLFALCRDHEVAPRSTARERAAHNEICPVMAARFVR